MQSRAEGKPSDALCAPTAHDLAVELTAAEVRAGRPIAWFVATNDVAWLRAQQILRPFKLLALADVRSNGTQAEVGAEAEAWAEGESEGEGGGGGEG